mmetsp:Transcript_31458/g.57102  ORF Transcript_31458/g.57102 Transcript_31458/m.57102 type:complete len:370 (-) Transcript_31458:76-1185(-)|eukprot:CAMPEP_0197661478 /NCGR_PEP_ID=MMETSP1338-20131121/51484_1 /TAXON_ID=43686 ORGANISM="Pelagodinium beii, Strain RCC1491" /NCGR_SAMPLE_ID=MMETSP1338 /ASSEMBLY_ACC=CAM_ASM_000754 /LENGTH=369 /DNA_ID=CAMNT_0043239043 /DNA_START=63 /DNA_END=1172 /DNA_ORIENTATION=+
MKIAITSVLAVLAGAHKFRTSSDASELETSHMESAYAAFLEKHERRSQDAVAYTERLTAFARTHAQVAAHNKDASRTWNAAVNRFADYTEAEKQQLLGYRRMGQWWEANRSAPAFLQEQPKALDWRKKAQSGTFFKDQGACGSCWAVAAAGALEVHAELHNSKVPKPLSFKELIDCVPNPKKCGGDGGCAGATGELAFEYVQQFGLSAATSYDGNHEATEPCKTDVRSASIRTSGFVRLPVNEYGPLMGAIQQGPVVVSVDGGPWSSYSSGVFTSCTKDATINHAVLLMGYGNDGPLDMDYWLVRNSWGSSWGEEGFIRIQRGSGYCGTDYDPRQGVGCEGGPATLPVCGMCGILSDSVYPEDVRYENA